MPYNIAWKGGFLMLKWLTGLLVAALLLMKPEAAANGAREAMVHWYYTVAPSLFPFMALLPLLTCDAAAHAYECLLGPITRRLYRLPGAAASALAVGMVAGSPAGCFAASRAASAGMTRGQAQRLAIACCGMSPAFLISGVGAVMLGSPSYGFILLRAQLLTQLLLPLFLRPFFKDSSPIQYSAPPSPTPPVLAILNICGYMTLFGAIAAALSSLLGESAGNICLCLLDITSGTRIISNINMKILYKIAALAALTGFGGLSICAQNLSALREIIRPAPFILARVAAAFISAGFAVLQIHRIPIKIAPNPLQISSICVVLLVIPVILNLNKHSFNNRKNSNFESESV